MIAIPAPVTDPRNLADWLELRALLAADQNASVSDLRRALNSVGGDASINTNDRSTGPASQDEVYASNAFTECEGRLSACGVGYPFELAGSLLKLKTDQSKAWAYVFCLLLSLKGANRGDADDSPATLFEEVAEIAARTYLSGESVKFGFPRRVLPAGFHAAVDEMCRRLGEGRGCKGRPSSRKDARLDIVAWRPFPDKRPAQFMLFGQCAAGGNWNEKLSEMQPRDFTDLYWIQPPIVAPVRGFFTPFRLSSENWEEHSKYGGILFERCRIAHLAAGESPPPGVPEWSQRVVENWKQ